MEDGHSSLQFIHDNYALFPRLYNMHGFSICVAYLHLISINKNVILAFHHCTASYSWLTTCIFMENDLKN